MRYIFGWIATGLSLSYKIPQIYKLIKTKNNSGLSNISLITQAFSYGFYLIHGLKINDPPIITLGAISFIQSCVIVYLYYKNNNSE